MSSVREGKVCVNVNMEREVKLLGVETRGCTVSSSFFYLVADALAVMLDKVVVKGHIKEILDNLIPGGISHISMLA